jgi:uncharacterized membrane protein
MMAAPVTTFISFVRAIRHMPFIHFDYRHIIIAPTISNVGAVTVKGA